MQTGDFVWDSKRDLASADEFSLIQQRLHRRLIIQRGEFIYDRSGELGSRLRSILNMGVPAASAGLDMLIREALEPMDDISVVGVEIFSFDDGSNVVTSPTNIVAKVTYTLRTDNVALPSDSLGQFTTNVTISQRG